MNINGIVGPQFGVAGIGDGVNTTARFGRQQDLIVSELQARYAEGTIRGIRFSAANTAGVTTTVGTATTYVGICLSNPVGNNKLLVLEKVGVAQLVAFAAAASIGIMVGYNSGTNVTHTTPLTPRSNYVGLGASATGLVDSSATLPTAPTLQEVFGAALTGAITTTPQITTFFDLEGSIVLPPGAYAALYTSTASGASGIMASMQWSEYAP